jgi:hypothetical protein
MSSRASKLVDDPRQEEEKLRYDRCRQTDAIETEVAGKMGTRGLLVRDMLNPIQEPNRKSWLGTVWLGAI